MTDYNKVRVATANTILQKTIDNMHKIHSRHKYENNTQAMFQSLLFNRITTDYNKVRVATANTVL